MMLAELLIATAILTMIVGTMAMLAQAVQQNSDYGDGHGEAAQHSRVTLGRICRNVHEASANASFPGLLVLSTQVGNWQFPDTLVVWHPARSASNPQGLPSAPTGLPLFQELVIYCPQPGSANNLMEITDPGDTRTVPAWSDTTNWATQIAAVIASKTATQTVLTDLLRTAVVSGTNNTTPRGMVRFVTRLTPSAAQWTSYQQAQLAWANLSWAQSLYGSTTGLRQVWLRIEMQLVPGEASLPTDPTGNGAIPFFGSATLYYQMPRGST
jgi:hypothetical protein